MGCQSPINIRPFSQGIRDPASLQFTQLSSMCKKLSFLLLQFLLYGPHFQSIHFVCPLSPLSSQSLLLSFVHPGLEVAHHYFYYSSVFFPSSFPFQ